MFDRLKPCDLHGHWYSDDKDGNQTDIWEKTPHSTQYLHSTATFTGPSLLTAVLASPAVGSVTYTLDGEGRWSSLADGSTTIVSGTTFNAAGQPLIISLDTSPDEDVYTYTPIGQMATWLFQVGSGSVQETGALNWNPNGTLADVNIVDGFNAAGSQHCYFNPSGGGAGYDDLGRLINDNCGSGWAQTFSYDQYDNLTQAGSAAFNPGYSSTTNQENSPATYDASGNQTKDQLGNTYAYDQFNKVTGINLGTCGAGSAKCTTYDAFGRMVETSSGSTYTVNWYTQAGMMNMSGASFVRGYWSGPGGGTHMEVGTSQHYWMHKDWLNNSRIMSPVNGGTRGATTDIA